MSRTITDVTIESYPASPDEAVRARAVIGHGQAGAWAMFVARRHVAGGTASAWVDLGAGRDLIGTFLEVSAVMKDVNDATNQLVLEVEVVGASTVTAVIEHRGNSGDSAAYSILIRFEPRAA